MDFLVELLVECIIEGSIYISSDRKRSKWIRYPLLFFVLSFFFAVIFGILYLGILFWEENKMIAVFFIVLSLFLAGGVILKFKNNYLRQKEEQKDEEKSK